MPRTTLHKFLPVFISTMMAIPAFGASHREAPLIALDPAADNTDTYAFRSWEDPDKIVFILNTIPGQDPADGPNYFAFDDTVLYEIHIDNNKDGRAEDLVYQVRFQTETRPALGSLNFPLPFVGNPNIGAVPALQGITALDGPGSEGLTRRQTFTVTEKRKKRNTLFKGQTLVAVPSNVGPATMPNYQALVDQGMYTDSETGIRVFAGQRAETFAIDLGAVFDTVNLRRFPPILDENEDNNDDANPFGINRFSGTNINSIVIEVPISRVTNDGQSADSTHHSHIGMYASTSRKQVKLLKGNGRSLEVGKDVQVSRLANPLVNELIINTPYKDQWNAAEPQDEAQFQEFYKAPTLATALNLIFGLPVPTTPRTDLMQVFLKYPGQPLNGSNCGYPCSDLLRLDVSVPPTAPEHQKRLGGLATPPDPAGFPNGRRPNDDVTDIGTRVVGGQAFIENRVGDGVNFLENAPGAGTSQVTANGIAKTFPYLPNPFDGRNRQHRDCGENGVNPCN
ncbi:DUF4331 domain-containing protein [uncultured Nitrospira sp.]|uniref:DUF4331 domain-containing protein n=1 Tax=uncultured Nitrospira sp. TaxID=157176 RepID=UPI003140012C